MSGSSTTPNSLSGSGPIFPVARGIGDKDTAVYDAIIARLERVEEGNFGDCGPVGGGVHELRFMMTGPGYRVYFGEHDGDIVIILGAGVKRTQDADIEAARKLWAEYNNG